MDITSTEGLALMFGLIGVVVVISALLSGFIERSGFPQVLVFLGLGAAVGPFGLGLLDVGLDTPILRVVATLSLSLVLFTDALTIDIAEVKKHAKLTTLILGPGTLIAAGVMTLAGVFVLKLSVPMAAMLAAALASTDPVMLRGLLKRSDIPSSARQALRLESGLNDVVLLPIVLVAMAFATSTGGHGDVGVGKLLLQMLVIGPGLGALVAWVGISGMVAIRSRVGIRRDYESLYSLGIALTAFAAAEALHGSGFLAVFAAGLMISSLDAELCDCFQEYGETTAEILLLFTFVLLGTSLIWLGLGTITIGIVLFALIALLARPLGLLLSLGKSRTESRAKKIIIWYGPRGLSTLLLVLLPTFAGISSAPALFHIATVVVLVSIAVHGGSIMLFGNRSKHHKKPELKPIANIHHEKAKTPETLTPEEIKKLGDQVYLVDVRRDAGYLDSPVKIKGALRASPMQARRDTEQQGIAQDALVAYFCACPNDETSLHVVEEMRQAGWWRAVAVAGGWDALIAAGFETEAK